MHAADSIPASCITGLILAGGRASRMGHADKGLQLFRGKPLAAHAIERLAPQVGSLAINANRSRDAYAAFNLPVWPDLLPGFPGPLAGLHSGLTHCPTEYLATAPCDSPLLPCDLVSRLNGTLTEQQANAAFAVTGPVSSRRKQPVFCLLRRTMLPSLDAFLHDGGRKMEDWLAGIGAAEAWFGDDAAFSNINTLQDLREMEQG